MNERVGNIDRGLKQAAGTLYNQYIAKGNQGLVQTHREIKDQYKHTGKSRTSTNTQGNQ